MRIKDWKILSFFSVLFICSVFFYCLYETFITIAGSQDSIMAQQYMQYNTNLGSPGYSTHNYGMATMNVGQPSATFMSQYPVQDGIQQYAAYSQTGYAISGSEYQSILSYRRFSQPPIPPYGDLMSLPYKRGVDIDIAVVVPSHPTIADFARNLYDSASLQSQYPFSGIQQQYKLLMGSGWAPETMQYTSGIPPFGTLPNMSEFIGQLPTIWPPQTRSVTLQDVARGYMTQYYKDIEPPSPELF